MFTGLVEHMGTITSIDPLDTTDSGGGGWSMTIGEAEPVLGDCHIGDSIACNGACLTVTEFTPSSFKVGLAPETLERTSLGQLQVGSKINLERAMAAHTRFGGHFVQGHVDVPCTILSSVSDANSLRLTFQLPPPTEHIPSLLPYLIPKGYVTLDGASLTLTEVDDVKETFSVMLIAHTQSKITLPLKSIGERVNVEVDMVGKYVLKAVEGALATPAGGKGTASGVEGIVERAVERVLARKGIA
uniref:Riboflavin synthase n=1 Tax=Bartheletia paradoxa TaxID=669517 RepID=A0A2D0XI55_9BASI|nr:hypothetical protein SPAR06416 [Bartheletia paradoxa]